jgi:hypothetical protein
MNELERIAIALEKIASLLEQPKTAKRAKKVSMNEQEKKNTVAALIATYIDSWQARYGTDARPDVGGRMQGVLRRIATTWVEQKAMQLIQVYCQMDDPWFIQKRHDLVTFEGNLNKVSLALDKGHELTGVNMDRVFNEGLSLPGGIDGQRSLSQANGPDDKNVGGQNLPARTNGDFLEGF